MFNVVFVRVNFVPDVTFAGFSYRGTEDMGLGSLSFWNSHSRSQVITFHRNFFTAIEVEDRCFFVFGGRFLFDCKVLTAGEFGLLCLVTRGSLGLGGPRSGPGAIGTLWRRFICQDICISYIGVRDTTNTQRNVYKMRITWLYIHLSGINISSELHGGKVWRLPANRFTFFFFFNDRFFLNSLSLALCWRCFWQ